MNYGLYYTNLRSYCILVGDYFIVPDIICQNKRLDHYERINASFEQQLTIEIFLVVNDHHMKKVMKKDFFRKQEKNGANR